jgi:hypothetical protein
MKKFFTFIVSVIMTATMTVNVSAEELTEELEVKNPYSIAACVAAAREVESNLITKSMNVIEVQNDTYRVFIYKDKSGIVTELVKIDRNRDGWDQLINAFAHLQEL